MKRLHLKILINFYRIIFIAPLYYFLFQKKECVHDFDSFCKYGDKRLLKKKFLGFLNLIINVKEYRNVLILRQNIFLKIIFNFLFPSDTSIHFTTQSKNIGRGLLVVHGFSSIINAKKIGKNFTFYQQVTIGYGNGGTPTIGDNVTVYAGAIIVGNIVIGNNTVIGAGTVVNKDLPENSICVGQNFRLI